MVCPHIVPGYLLQVCVAAASRVATVLCRQSPRIRRAARPLVGALLVAWPGGGHEAPLPTGHPGVSYGIFTEEAARRVGLRGAGHREIHDAATFRRVQAEEVRLFGRALDQMTYWGMGMPGWQARLAHLKAWLLMAGVTGPVKISIKTVPRSWGGAPLRPGMFTRSNPEWVALLEVLAASGQEIHMRPLSEGNLTTEPYVPHRVGGLAVYKKAIRNIRATVPRNVKLVFSPSITPDLSGIGKVWVPGIFDIIGGTLYSRGSPGLDPLYRPYYCMMMGLAPEKPFCIDELGAPQYEYRRTIEFLKSLEWKYPRVIEVTLFSADINHKVSGVPNRYGFVLGGTGSSYLKGTVLLPYTERTACGQCDRCALAGSKGFCRECPALRGRHSGPTLATGLAGLASRWLEARRGTTDPPM